VSRTAGLRPFKPGQSGNPGAIGGRRRSLAMHEAGQGTATAARAVIAGENGAYRGEAAAF